MIKEFQSGKQKKNAIPNCIRETLKELKSKQSSSIMGMKSRECIIFKGETLEVTAKFSTATMDSRQEEKDFFDGWREITTN